MSSQKQTHTKKKLVWAVKCCCNRFRFECMHSNDDYHFEVSPIVSIHRFPLSKHCMLWHGVSLWYLCEMHHKHILILHLLLLNFPSTMTQQFLFECNLIWCHMNDVETTFFYISHYSIPHNSLQLCCLKTLKNRANVVESFEINQHTLPYIKRKKKNLKYRMTTKKLCPIFLF
jgi:hypothetical protein